MTNFLELVFHQDAPIEQLVRRYTLRTKERELFESFDEIDLRDFGLTELNRWSVALAAVRAEEAWKRAETVYGDRLLSHYYPLAVAESYGRIARLYAASDYRETLYALSALNALSSIASSRMAQENLAYLGRAGLALQSYGLTLTAYLEPLGLKMSAY